MKKENKQTRKTGNTAILLIKMSLTIKKGRVKQQIGKNNFSEEFRIK